MVNTQVLIAQARAQTKRELRRVQRLAMGAQPQAGALSNLGMGAIALRVSLGSQPRTKSGGAVSSMYRGRMQSNASRLPGSWSDSFHYKALPMLIASDYLAGLQARRKAQPMLLPWANVQTLRYPEFSMSRQMVVTKSKRIKIGDGTGSYQPPSELSMRGAPCLFDDCQQCPDVLIRVGQRHWESMNNYWLYQWTADIGCTGYDYIGRVYYGPHAGAYAYDYAPSVPFSRRSKVVFHEPLPVGPDTNGLIRATKAGIPNLDAMLDDWRARQQLAWLELLGVEL